MKIDGSIPSLVQGVSQQPAISRRPGQHTEVVNMVPDPVKGLARRHGSIWQAEQNLASSANIAAALQDSAQYRSFEYTNQGTTYAVFYRTGAIVTDSPLPVAVVFNKTTGQFLTTTTAGDPLSLLLASGGVSAITSVGRYVFMAGNTIVPEATTVNAWAAAANQGRAVVWVRGGAYSRTFKVRATKTDNSVVNFEYTTPASAYGQTLDTSGVPLYAADPAGGTETTTEAAYITASGGNGVAKLSKAAWNPSALTVKNGTTTLTNVSPSLPANASQYSWAAGAATVTLHSSLVGANTVTLSYTNTKTVLNPNYSATVNDITAAYNSAVTAWIGTAAAAIQPQAIAESLKNAAVAAGLTAAVRVNSSVVFENIKELVVQDGGDGSLVRGVANTVAGPEDVSSVHYVGKVIKVQAPESGEAYYLRAVPKATGLTGWTEVAWVEGAGVESTITSAFCYGTVEGSVFHIAGSATSLAGAVPGPHPDFTPSTVGDLDSNELPFFIGRKISYMGVFQDRLLIGAGAVLTCSQTSEYLNFFRNSVVTVAGDDAFSMQARGIEDDELRFGVDYDRDLVIFGAKRQYAVSGRVPLTPTNANFPVVSEHSGAGDTPAKAAGSLIFYAKRGEASSSVHQIQPGQVVESPESYLASSQLDDYITGDVGELAAVAKPSVLVARAESRPNELFLFHYVDLQDGRRQDAWHRWQFDPALGSIIGMAPDQDTLLVFFVREAHGRTWLVADRCSMVAGLDRYPYLDSHRPLATVSAGTGSLRTTTVGPFFAAFDNSTTARFFGRPLAEVTNLQEDFPAGAGIRVGAGMLSEFVPTNPLVLDQGGQAITTGRLTVTKVVVNYTDTSAFDAEITYRDTVVSSTNYQARTLGSPINLIGRVPVERGQATITIGRETSEYSLSIKSVSWLPLTLTSMQFVGQFFHRPRRV